MFKNKTCLFMPVLILFLLTVIFWHKLVFTNKVLFFDLTCRFFYPISAFIAQSVKNGLFPAWNPFIYAGVPFAANPQSAVFYPFSYLNVFLDYPSALNINVILHTFLAGLFMLSLSRTFKMGFAGSIACSIIFMFNGYFSLHAGLVSHISSYIWLPLILLFFHRFLLYNRTMDAVFTSLFLAVQLFAGHPQFLYYTFWVLLIYYMLAGRQYIKNASYFKHFIKTVAAILLPFLCFGMAQILPFAELVMNSSRGAAFDYAGAASYSLKPANLAMYLFSPLWNWRAGFITAQTQITGIYLGVSAVILFLASLKKIKEKKEIALLALFMLSIILSMGGFLPFYKFLHNYTPGLKYFRFPAQVLYISVFSFSLLAGTAIDKLKNSGLKIFFMLLIFSELFLFGTKSNLLIDKSFYKNIPQTVKFLKSDHDLFRYSQTPALRRKAPEYDEDFFKRWLNFQEMLYPNSSGIYGLYDADGYETLALAAYRGLLNSIDSFSSRILDILNVKYVLSEKYSDNPGFTLEKDGYVKIYRNNSFLARFYFVNKAKFLAENKILEYMASPEFEYDREITLEEPFAETAAPGKKQEALVAVSKYSFNETVLKVNAPCAGWLVCSEAFYPGWQAEVDGKKTKIYRANYALRAVPVNQGVHSIKMYFRPLSLRIGFYISLSSFLLLFLFSSFYLLNRPARPATLK